MESEINSDSNSNSKLCHIKKSNCLGVAAFVVKVKVLNGDK